MAMLLITHDLNLVRRFADRVGVMERGRLVEQGATARVFAQPQRPVHAAADQQPAAARGARRLPAGRPGPRRRRQASASTFGRRAGWFGKDVFTRRARRHARVEARRDARHRRRVRLRQDDARHGAARAAARRRGRACTLDGERIDTPTGRRCARCGGGCRWCSRTRSASLSPRMTDRADRRRGPRAAPARASTRRAPAAHRRDARRGGAVEAAGLTDVLTRYPHEFSGGQRQRIAIARAVDRCGPRCWCSTSRPRRWTSRCSSRC